MNIFYTHSSPFQAAKEHCIVHRNKMITEYCQMLSTAHHVLDGIDAMVGIFKPAYVNHPCTKWVRQSLSHYIWLLEVALHLSELYTEHTKKIHKSGIIAVKLNERAPINMIDRGWIDPPLCMPDRFHVHGPTTECYKEYLLDKFSGWKSTYVVFQHTPYWYTKRREQE